MSPAMTVSPERLLELQSWPFNGDVEELRALVTELQHSRAAEAVDDAPVRNDDIAAASILYQCADCVVAEADYSCHNRDDVFIIGGKVICRDCADAGHQGEQRRAVPDIAAKLKRQRMAIAHEQRKSASPASPSATGVRMKPLVWERYPEQGTMHEGLNDRREYVSRAVILWGAAFLMKSHDAYSFSGGFGEELGEFHTSDAALSAFQAAYDDCVLSALAEQS